MAVVALVMPRLTVVAAAAAVVLLLVQAFLAKQLTRLKLVQVAAVRLIVQRTQTH